MLESPVAIQRPETFKDTSAPRITIVGLMEHAGTLEKNAELELKVTKQQRHSGTGWAEAPEMFEMQTPDGVGLDD